MTPWLDSPILRSEKYAVKGEPWRLAVTQSTSKLALLCHITVDNRRRQSALHFAPARRQTSRARTYTPQCRRAGGQRRHDAPSSSEQGRDTVVALLREHATATARGLEDEPPCEHVRRHPRLKARGAPRRARCTFVVARPRSARALGARKKVLSQDRRSFAAAAVTAPATVRGSAKRRSGNWEQ